MGVNGFTGVDYTAEKCSGRGPGRIRTAATALIVLAVCSAPGAARSEDQLASTGGIYGQVFLGTANPRVVSRKIFKDNLICGTQTREIPVVRGNGEALLDAVVFIEKAPMSKPFPASARKVTINQEGCTFTPYLSILANGGELEIINSDPVLHNIHAYEQVGALERTMFSVSQPQRGDITHYNIDKGRALRLTCDAHDFMLGYVFVATNPFYDAVDNKGRFRITGLPAGTYTITAWHGVLGLNSQTVTITGGALVSLDFAY